MNTRIKCWAAAMAVAIAWGLPCASSQAQIADNEASAQFLAGKIVESAGGTVQQYLAYAKKLAKTLSQLPAAKQQEILGIVLGDGNNGHGNDPGGVDPSNPGKSKEDEED